MQTEGNHRGIQGRECQPCIPSQIYRGSRPPSLQDGTVYRISKDTTRREGIDVTKLPEQRVERHRHQETSSVMKKLDVPAGRIGQLANRVRMRYLKG